MCKIFSINCNSFGITRWYLIKILPLDNAIPSCYLLLQWRYFVLFIVNFEQISHIEMVFPFMLWTSKGQLDEDTKQKQPPKVFYKKSCSQNFYKINRKTQLHRCFPVNFVKFLRTPFLLNTPGWLPLIK